MSNTQQVQMLQAINNTKGAKPAFTVEKLTGKFKKTIHRFDKEARKIVSKDVEVPQGYLVKFPKGHSIHCETKEQLDAIGAGTTLVPLIDDDGEQVGAVQNSVAA